MMKKRIIYILILITICTVCIGGCRRAGAWLIKNDLPAHADAMVLLMGSFPERVIQAADLYHDGRANRLMIVHESMGAYKLLELRGAKILTNTEQARNSAIDLGMPADSITILPGDARSTLNEAVIIRSYLAGKPDIDTIILVSSPSHMRRASMIFKSALRDSPKPVFIGCSPSAYSGFNPDGWWRRKEDAQAVLSEIVKIGSFVMFEKRGMRRSGQANN
jgi:uncharacterized SAM-binding protein YcdF (DUF218 family)